MNQSANTRESIIQAAHRLLLQRGMNGFSYRDIAQPLGVRNAAIHYHFPSKMDLVKALIEDNLDVLHKGTAEFMAYGGPARPQLEGLFEFTRHQSACGRPVCMVGALSIDFEELSDEARRALERLMRDTVAWLAKVLETGREQAEFDFRGKARPKAAAILATIQGARQIARIHGMELLEATFAQIRTDLGIET
jgi:AcrR family transcriptional regulator